jgi:putative PIN family toxin of toxin-antitoxin system
VILDTDVISSAIRSTKGASAEIVRRALRREIHLELTVAIALEYEAVATRAEHLMAGELTEAEALNVIDALVAVAKPVEVHFRWRPQLRDADDEMILEAAINAKDRRIVTFNKKDFAPAVTRFGLGLMTPAEFLETLK